MLILVYLIGNAVFSYDYVSYINMFFVYIYLFFELINRILCINGIEKRV